MSDSPPVDIVDIGTVASVNIARAIGVPDEAAPVIKKHIADEINAMSSHFTLAFADIQTQYEAAVYQAKAEYEKAIGAFNYVKTNKLTVALSGLAVFTFGALIRYIV